MDTFADGRELLERLVQLPGETLNVEIKAWLDPTQAADAAKIIKACFALRNRNGGHLLIGFQDRSLQPDELAKLGTWTVAMVVDPPRDDAVPDQTFLNIIDASNPNYTGWPIWMDTRGFSDQEARPKVVEGAWQTLTVSMAKSWSDHVDFFRFDPRGEFLLVRVLQDDMTNKVAPGKALDPVLVILRVAEAIAVGLAFVKELEWDLETTKLGFAFKWTKLRARELTPWGQPNIIFSPGRTAHDDEVSTFIEVPANTPVSAIAPLVHEATRDLFVLFDGFTFPKQNLENWVERLIERKL